MAPSSGTQGSSPKLPSTSDFNQVFNRINLSLSKHTSFLQNIRARHPQPAQPAASATTATTTATTGAGFSSLAGKSSSASVKPSSTGSLYRKTQADLDAEEAQFAEHSADVAAAALGSNAGIGYIPERKAVERIKEDRDLRGRLLGKRAREQLDEAAKKRARQRRGDSSDEEEEVGRSGLGRSKKPKSSTLLRRLEDDEDIDRRSNGVVTPIYDDEEQIAANDGPAKGDVEQAIATDSQAAIHFKRETVSEQQANVSEEGTKKKRKKKKKRSQKDSRGEP